MYADQISTIILCNRDRGAGGFVQDESPMEPSTLPTHCYHFFSICHDKPLISHVIFRFIMKILSLERSYDDDLLWMITQQLDSDSNFVFTVPRPCFATFLLLMPLSFANAYVYMDVMLCIIKFLLFCTCFFGVDWIFCNCLNRGWVSSLLTCYPYFVSAFGTFQSPLDRVHPRRMYVYHW